MSELERQIESLMADAEKCAKTYEEKPGMAGPEAIIDLYRAIARLAIIVKHADALRNVTATS